MKNNLKHCLLVVSCLAVNIIAGLAASGLKLPIFLDTAGTIIAAVLGGYMPGIIVGFLTNLILGFNTQTTVFYGIVNILIGLAAAFLADHGFFDRKKPWKLVVPVITFVLLSGTVGAILAWKLHEGEDLGSAMGSFGGRLLTELGDKTIVTALAVLAIWFIPKSILPKKHDEVNETPAPAPALQVLSEADSVRSELVEQIKALVLDEGEYTAGTQVESEVLKTFVEKCDASTGENIRNTVELVKIIVDGLSEEGCEYKDRMTEQFRNDVIASAPLHDIGKVMIPDSILNKPGQLTDEEFEVMKLHTIEGGKIIDDVIKRVGTQKSGCLNEARYMASYHHEKWMGGGYPEGLSGEDIPLSARIMAVADVFDALVSPRCYKPSFTFEEAMNVIRKDAGSHFDPVVAKAFVDASEKVKKINY